MRALPLLAGCSLTPAGQAARAREASALLPAVASVESSPGRAQVGFSKALDTGLLERLLAAERSCCLHLGFELDRQARTLSISGGPGHEADVAAFARLFEEGAP